MDPDVKCRLDWTLTLWTSCCSITARCFGENQDIMASSVPLPDLEKHRRNAQVQATWLPSLKSNERIGQRGDLGEGRTEVGSGGSKASEFPPAAKHPPRHTHEPLLISKVTEALDARVCLASWWCSSGHIVRQGKEKERNREKNHQNKQTETQEHKSKVMLRTIKREAQRDRDIVNEMSLQ